MGLKKVTLIKIPQKNKNAAYKKILKDSLSMKGLTLIEYNKKGTIKTNNTGTLSPATKTESSLAVFNVLYKKEQQSVLEFKEKVIFVDENGNYSPVVGIVYSGYFGLHKLGNFLPADYYQAIKIQNN